MLIFTWACGFPGHVAPQQAQTLTNPVAHCVIQTPLQRVIFWRAGIVSLAQFLFRVYASKTCDTACIYGALCLYLSDKHSIEEAYWGPPRLTLPLFSMVPRVDYSELTPPRFP